MRTMCFGRNNHPTNSIPGERRFQILEKKGLRQQKILEVCALIISHEHRFVFVQVPQTASTFLGNLFIEKYGGEKILDKHSTYTEFLKVATEDEKTYAIIIGKRNPMNKAATRYARRVERRGIEHRNMEEILNDFEIWFRSRYVDIERNKWNPHLRRCYSYADHVISQENLVHDLRATFSALDLAADDIPPWSETTRKKLDHYSHYYSDALVPLALEAFGDEMDQLNYKVPSWCERRLAAE